MTNHPKHFGTQGNPGEYNSMSRLTECQIRDILFLWHNHGHLPMKVRKRLRVTLPALAEDFGVSKGHMSHVINRHNWKHVEVE